MEKYVDLYELGPFCRLQGAILEKPDDAKDAFRMLSSLSGTRWGTFWMPISTSAGRHAFLIKTAGNKIEIPVNLFLCHPSPLSGIAN